MSGVFSGLLKAGGFCILGRCEVHLAEVMIPFRTALVTVAADARQITFAGEAKRIHGCRKAGSAVVGIQAAFAAL